MGRIANFLVKGPVDAIGRSLIKRMNTPMSAVGAAATGAITGIAVANRVSTDGVASVGGGGSIAMNGALGALMLGLGSAYSKPYFRTMGQATLGATAVGVAFGALNHGAGLIPEVDLKVSLVDRAHP